MSVKKKAKKSAARRRENTTQRNVYTVILAASKGPRHHVDTSSAEAQESIARVSQWTETFVQAVSSLEAVVYLKAAGSFYCSQCFRGIHGNQSARRRVDQARANRAK